jgi:hypothetical protein
LRRRYSSSLKMLSPSSVNLVVDVYTQIGRDLRDLGLGGARCMYKCTF